MDSNKSLDLSQVVVAVTTFPPSSPEKKESASSLAKRLVQERAAACVQQTPISSTYRWPAEGDDISIDNKEIRLEIKTVVGKIDDVQRIIKEMHPYDLAEFIVVPCIGGDEKYLKWVRNCTNEAKK